MKDPVFFSACGERPVRLSRQTRELADRALSGEIGKSMMDMKLELDQIEAVETMSDTAKYALSIRLIAENAPLRLLPGEMLAGASTLEWARKHFIPVYYKDKPVFQSVSHLTCGFDRIVETGYQGLRTQIQDKLEHEGTDPQGVELLQAMLSCLDAAKVWHDRYVALLEERVAQSSGDEQLQLQVVLDSLRNVPEASPQTFREAVQSLWMMFDFLRLCGNWPGIGRIDLILGPYLKQDLTEGKITLEEARELLAHFWIKGCEWIVGEECGTGDAQHYQNIVLGGIDEAGVDVTNEVTYLVLDIIEELGISDFPVAVRIGGGTPEALLRRIAEVQRHGGGVVAIYNEELIIQSMVDFGYELSEARRFANDGCWEVQVPGKTCFGYYPFDMFAILQHQVLKVCGDSLPLPDYPDFEALYAAFRTELHKEIDKIQDSIDGFASGGQPACLVALFIEGCIEKGRDYYDRGAKYTVLSPHAGGLPDTANSLLAIRNLVYDRKRLDLPALVDCLRHNWEGQEGLRRYSAQGIDYFGNDSPEADAMAKRVYEDYVAMVRENKLRNGVLRPPGISTFGRQIDWRWNRGAAADGHLEGEILSGNLSPTPGSDKKGATAIIRSHCSLGLQELTCGTALDIKLFPNTVKGEQGTGILTALMKGFIDLGGIFMQVDILDNTILLDAQEHPERYQNLAVRVSGWSARFVTLNREWQEMIINRTAQKV